MVVRSHFRYKEWLNGNTVNLEETARADNLSNKIAYEELMRKKESNPGITSGILMSQLLIVCQSSVSAFAHPKSGIETAAMTRFQAPRFQCNSPLNAQLFVLD